MKKILIQFAALLLVICGIFMISGHTDGWVQPPEEEATGDIILSGTKYNGKVVVTFTLHPDGTGEHEGNGEKSPATWEKGEGDTAMVVHFSMKGNDYDMEVRDNGSQYVAAYPLVGDFELTGSKPVKPIILSGTKYNGKVVVKITLNPDGTGEHEGNGEKTPATWEKGEGDVAMVVHFSMKGSSYDMNVLDNGTQYVADYPLVGDFQLTGGKNGAEAPVAEEAAPAEEPKAEETAQPAAEEKPTEASKADEPAFAANTFVLTYIADINEKLTGSFHAEEAVWTAALGNTGGYVPAESKDVLLSWASAGASKELDLLADGTYEFRYAKMGITEHGTWTYADGKLALTSEAGRVMEAELIQ